MTWIFLEGEDSVVKGQSQSLNSEHLALKICFVDGLPVANSSPSWPPSHCPAGRCSEWHVCQHQTGEADGQQNAESPLANPPHCFLESWPVDRVPMAGDM